MNKNMFLLKSILTLAICLSLSSAWAKKPLPKKKSPAHKQVETWSYNYLARAANFIAVAADADAKESGQFCGIKNSEAMLMSQPLKALVDERLTKLLKQRLDAKTLQQAKDCQQDCTCPLYSNLLEEQKSQVALFNVVTHQAEQLSKEDRLKCANSFKEFCTSTLMLKLQKQVRYN